MRILYLSHERKMGGANRALYELATAMRERGHEIYVSVLFKDCPLAIECKKVGIETVPSFFGWWMQPYVWPWYMKAAFRFLHFCEPIEEAHLARFIKNKKVDIVHSNTSTIDMGAKLGKRTGVKHVWHVREFGDRDYQLEFMCGREQAIQYMNNGADKIICISQALREHYSELRNVEVIHDGVLGIEKNVERTRERIRAGVQNAKKASDAEVPCNSGTDINNQIVINKQTIIKNAKRPRLYTFLIVGNLIPGKNQILAVEAAGILQKSGITGFQLNIAGPMTAMTESKNYAERIKNRITELNLQETVHLLGYVEDMVATRDNADAEIVASRAEGYGRVTIEAMAAGNLVIASDSGANRELLGAYSEQTGVKTEPIDVNTESTDANTEPADANAAQIGENEEPADANRERTEASRGLLFTDNDANSLAEAMIWAMTHTKETKQIEQSNLDYIINNHTTETAVKKVEQVYFNLVNN